jgi:hypothetical protein
VTLSVVGFINVFKAFLAQKEFKRVDWCTSIVFYSLIFLLKQFRGLLNEERLVFGVFSAYGVFEMIVLRAS